MTYKRNVYILYGQWNCLYNRTIWLILDKFFRRKINYYLYVENDIFFQEFFILYMLYCYRFPNKAVAFATGGKSTKRKSNDILHIEFFFIQMELFGLCFPLVFRWLFPHSHTYTHSHIHPHPPTTAYETRWLNCLYI